MRQRFIIVFFLISNSTLAQRRSGQIEINPFVRFDKYPQFSYVLSGRPSTDYVNMKGTSIGINATYIIPVSRSFFLGPGIGFYKYSFNHISKENTQFGTAEARDINYISPLFINFYTDKYWYNSLSVNMGIEKNVFGKKNYQTTAGLNINNYFTFSQFYHLTNNPAGSKDFRKNSKNYFGSSVALKINIAKMLRQISLGPSLMIPVFDIWKTDATFQEETNSGTRTKWFKGIDVGLAFKYLLSKK